MSWLARSIRNSLKFDDDDDLNAAHKQPDIPGEVTSPASPSRGVKEDLSEISKTLSRQFWGVASYLAPPEQGLPDPDAAESDQGSVLGDLAEIGGRFRGGISRLSSGINVSEITKLASNLLQLESDDESEGAAGVTEEVVAFARDIAVHPETWLDFQLPENVDFDMTDAQQEHALAVERLSPRLAALRIELCPGYMPESCFWMIYFVLLHPRLDKQDAELLSTPQVMEARSLLVHELKNQNVTQPSEEKSSKPKEIDISRQKEPFSFPSLVISEDEANKSSELNIATSSIPSATTVVHNSVKKTDDKDQYLKPGSSDVSNLQDEDDADDWLKEDTSEVGGKKVQIKNEDEVSFSDLEDDGDFPSGYRKSNYSSDKDSRDWVQLGKSSSDKESGGTRESNDWLDVDDIGVS